MEDIPHKEANKIQNNNGNNFLNHKKNSTINPMNIHNIIAYPIKNPRDDTKNTGDDINRYKKNPILFLCFKDKLKEVHIMHNFNILDKVTIIFLI